MSVRGDSGFFSSKLGREHREALSNCLLFLVSIEQRKRKQMTVCQMLLRYVSDPTECVCWHCRQRKPLLCPKQPTEPRLSIGSLASTYTFRAANHFPIPIRLIEMVNLCLIIAAHTTVFIQKWNPKRSGTLRKL